MQMEGLDSSGVDVTFLILYATTETNPNCGNSHIASEKETLRAISLPTKPLTYEVLLRKTHPKKGEVVATLEASSAFYRNFGGASTKDSSKLLLPEALPSWTSWPPRAFTRQPANF